MKRIALITGAAGGIGRATMQSFASAGWETVCIDRKDVGDFPSDVVFRQVDASDPDGVSGLFKWMGNQYDRLDALVNNAAIQICKPLTEMTVEEWDATMASNLRSIFLMAREGHSLLKAAKGAIVNVSSVHAVATSTNR